MIGGGEFSACTNFFFRSLLVHEFFFQVNPSAITTCEKVTIGPSFCMIFFLPSSLHDFFSWHFPLHEFIFGFPSSPPPPHHFSNGPSLIIVLNERMTVFTVVAIAPEKAHASLVLLFPW